MRTFSQFVSGFYNAIGDIAESFLTLEIIPGLHMATLVFIGLVATVVLFFLTGGESS